MKKLIFVVIVLITIVVSLSALPQAYCTVRSACSNNVNDFVECSSDNGHCERGSYWVKCDGTVINC